MYDGSMFRFPPPPRPQLLDVPCRQCGCRCAVPVYATSAMTYMRCADCRAVFSEPRGHWEASAAEPGEKSS
jgi:hypothetical protein